MMPKTIRRCLTLTLLAVAGIFLSSCSSTGGRNTVGTPVVSDKNYDKALLYVDKNLFGTKRVYAYPDPLVIPNYGNGEKPRDVTWLYIHKGTKITLNEKDKDAGTVECVDRTGVCTLTLTGDLLKGAAKRTLKYTIAGVEGQGKLHDNDPEVEIDR